jgi:GAF domain-containing protein
MLGVLDVQSAGQTAFSQNELQALQLLAEQVSTALLHARTVNDLQRTLNEQVNVNNRLQNQVADYTQRERRGVTTTWNQYLEGRGKTIIGYNIEPDNTTTPVPANDVPETLQATLQSGQLHVESVGEEQIVNVPITFRDQTLGAMSFAVPKGQQLSERQVEMARIVAERLALALENTRLFEQSQAQALRERKASEVSGLLIGATDVYSVLNLAAQNFNEALGAIHTRIYIQPGVFAEPLAESQEEEVR